MASLSLRHIYKVYSGGVRAVSDFNLEIDDKEFIVFVGPSGCGKSTTLRMIAGLEDISSGELYIEDRLVNDVEPKDRDIAMVFQNYALYPHMTVYDNMAFGLRLRHVPAKVIDEKVQEAASILGIQHLLSRRPKALSGGQRQRVALGRAIVREPKVFLLDEPLSNLDAKLRVQMRTEITKIHHRLATTFIYVTHDQTEAMTMGTRIVVMKDGIVQQVDTPTTLYDNPANLFVACFLGSPQMNIFKAKLVEENGNLYALIGETNKVMIPKSRALRIRDKSIIGSDVLLGIRPEDVRYEQALIDAHPESVIEATVDVIENLGNETILYLNVEGKDDYTIARVNARYSFEQGDKVKMYLATEHAHLFDATTELTLMGVPDYNLIPAQAVAVENTLAVMFGDVCIKLPEEILNRITDKSVINNKVVLGLPPEALKAEGGEGDVCFEGVAEFFDNYPRFKAVYLAVPGLVNNLIVSRPLDYEFNGGETMKVYLDPTKIQLFNMEGERIIADRPVTGNTTTGTMLNNNGVYNYKFVGKTGTKNKLAVENQTGLKTAETDAPMYILPRGLSIDKDAIAKSPKMVLSGVIKHLDEYNRDAIVTAEIAGFDEDMTVIIRKFAGYNTGDKIKMVVDPQAIVIGKYETFAQAVKNSDAQAEGEVRYKELLQARENEKALENAAAGKKEQAAVNEAAEVEEAPAKKPAAKKPAAKKPAAKKAPAAKKPAAKKAPAVKKPAAKKK
ncbi:MAG: ABC transporter ATP-binding protein [Clostridiales bacterium]|nr:ABC transporter ATP-binding protein [Clostridiales bacterium]